MRWGERNRVPYRDGSAPTTAGIVIWYLVLLALPVSFC